ncbi:MAG: hypothetical protein RR123_00630 [Clostridia bacterium]
MEDGKVCCNTINDIIESVALEETGIAHILNAEGEKIQKALELAQNVDDLLKINCSVQNTITNITNLECALFNKIKTIINVDCNDCPVVEKGCIIVKVCVCNTSQPLANISVKIYNQSSVLVGSGVTNTNGIYSLCALKNGVYTVVVKDLVTQQTQTFTATITNAEKEITIKTCFERPCENGIGLCVYDCKSKRPLANIDVKLYDSNNVLIDQKLTNSEGKYIKLGLAFGVYRLVVTNTKTGDFKEITVTLNSENRFVETEVCFNTCINNEVNIEGVVTDQYGKPLCNANVFAQGLGRQQTRTDKCGRYAIKNLKICNEFSIYAVCNNCSSVVYFNGNPTKKSYNYNIKIKI